MATAIVAPVADEIDRRRAFRVIPGGVANGQLGDDVEVVFGPRQRILARRTSCRLDAGAALSSSARRSPAETALAQACGVLIFFGNLFRARGRRGQSFGRSRFPRAGARRGGERGGNQFVLRGLTRCRLGGYLIF